ncbi:MAG: Hint domain-containing protein [Paracoccus sp. (in: a-proteobacteria)]
MGINLKDLTKNPNITLVHDREEGPGNYDNWIYTIDVDQFIDPAQTITITADWHLLGNENADGSPSTDGGEYVAAQIPNPNGASLTFGDLNIDFGDGAMAWTFTYQELLDNAGQNFDVYFVGKYDNQGSDSDLLRLEITCFLTGTQIMTPKGQVNVETLVPGDTVTTADGRNVPVRWIGHKTLKRSVFLADDLLPVRVSAGALGHGVPHSDLYLSANHGLILDEVLVNASALVNGDTIRFVSLEDMPESFTYHHIETETHDEVLANGARAETFVDYVGRSDFDNYNDYLKEFGCDRIIQEMKRPRISSRRQLPQATLQAIGLSSFSAQVQDEADLLTARLCAA